MIWSYSASRAFKRCQRQWFFSSIAANGNASDPVRRRALFYGKLNTISAWRGHIVDKVISDYVVPKLSGRAGPGMPTLEQAIKKARSLFDTQRAYADQHRAKTIDVTITKEGDPFTLLFANEFGDPPEEADFERAWAEVETSLTNLWGHDPIRDLMKRADRLMPQRMIYFDIAGGLRGNATPDLVAFKDDEPPVIIDWKVHAQTGNDARLQLATYAIALSRCTNPHTDFPLESEEPPQSMRLIEAQLLLNQFHEYELDEDDVADVDAYIISTAYEMASLDEGKKYDGLDVADFDYAFDGSTCDACVFQTLCQEVTANAA